MAIIKSGTRATGVARLPSADFAVLGGGLLSRRAGSRDLGISSLGVAQGVGIKFLHNC